MGQNAAGQVTRICHHQQRPGKWKKIAISAQTSERVIRLIWHSERGICIIPINKRVWNVYKFFQKMGWVPIVFKFCHVSPYNFRDGSYIRKVSLADFKHFCASFIFFSQFFKFKPVFSCKFPDILYAQSPQQLIPRRNIKNRQNHWISSRIHFFFSSHWGGGCITIGSDYPVK